MKTTQQKMAYSFGIIAGIAGGLIWANLFCPHPIFEVIGVLLILLSSVLTTLFNWTKE